MWATVLALARAISITLGRSIRSKGKASEYGAIEVCPSGSTVVTQAKGIGKNDADW
jgi:hypothetical protein